MTNIKIGPREKVKEEIERKIDETFERALSIVDKTIRNESVYNPRYYGKVGKHYHKA
jgi:hypothetical protein